MLKLSLETLELVDSLAGEFHESVVIHCKGHPEANELWIESFGEDVMEVDFNTFKVTVKRYSESLRSVQTNLWYDIVLQALLSLSCSQLIAFCSIIGMLLEDALLILAMWNWLSGGNLICFSILMEL